jgi:putative ABC transport system permease protein
LEQRMQQSNANVEALIPKSVMGKAVSGHVYILIFALILMASLMAVVGGLGLMSTMGSNIAERTPEFGIMRTIGGTSPVILRNIIGEGLFIGLISFAIAIVISLPLSALVGRLIGQLAFRSPLPLILSADAVWIWLAVMVLGTAAASLYPAYRASKLTIRESIVQI